MEQTTVAANNETRQHFTHSGVSVAHPIAKQIHLLSGDAVTRNSVQARECFGEGNGNEE
jgi:hypothetical protein